MTRNQLKEVLTRIDRWLNTPTSYAARPETLRWWFSPTRFDKYFGRVILLATLASAFYLFGCNSAASAGQEYIGTWEHITTRDHAATISLNAKVITEKTLDTLTITKDGDHFLIQHNTTIDDAGKITTYKPQTYPATLANGILHSEGTNEPYTYQKATDTLLARDTVHPLVGNVQYHRGKQP